MRVRDKFIPVRTSGRLYEREAGREHRRSLACSGPRATREGLPVYRTSLIVVLLATSGCFKEIAPAGPIADAEATLGAPVAASGMTYSGSPAVDFPVAPFRLWGLDFPEELLWEFGDDPTYGMVEIARITRRDGSSTFFALVSEKGGLQHVGTGDPADVALAAAFPAPAYDARLRVVRLESATHLSYDVAFHLPDGRLVQGHLQSKNAHKAPTERNGNAMNHSEGAVLAVLDLREMGLATATVYVDDHWVPVRVLLPFVPYSMRLVQAAGGVASGDLRFERAGDGITATNGAVETTFAVAASEDGEELRGADPITDHVYRYRALGPARELTSVTLRHGDVDVFSARFNPPLPDLRWPLDRTYSSRVVAGSNGQDGYMVGEVRIAPREGGGAVVDVLPESRRWACERPVRTEVTFEGGGVNLAAVIDPTLAADGAGPEGCAALDK